MPLLTWQLWLAREIVIDDPLPWQKLIVNKLTPGRVARVFGRSFGGEQRVAGVPPVVATANPKGDWYTITFP